MNDHAEYLLRLASVAANHASQKKLTAASDYIDFLEKIMRTFEQAVPVLATTVTKLQTDNTALIDHVAILTAANADLTAKLTAAEANTKSPADAAAEAAVVTLTESLSPST